VHRGWTKLAGERSFWHGLGTQRKLLWRFVRAGKANPGRSPRGIDRSKPFAGGRAA